MDDKPVRLNVMDEQGSIIETNRFFGYSLQLPVDHDRFQLLSAEIQAEIQIGRTEPLVNHFEVRDTAFERETGSLVDSDWSVVQPIRSRDGVAREI